MLNKSLLIHNISYFSFLFVKEKKYIWQSLLDADPSAPQEIQFWLASGPDLLGAMVMLATWILGKAGDWLVECRGGQRQTKTSPFIEVVRHFIYCPGCEGFYMTDRFVHSLSPAPIYKTNYSSSSCISLTLKCRYCEEKNSKTIFGVLDIETSIELVHKYISSKL